MPDEPWKKFPQQSLLAGQRAVMESVRILELRQLWRVLVHSILVGLMAGLVACVFFVGTEWGTYFLLDFLGGQAPAVAPGEHITPHTEVHAPRYWLIALMPALGGVLCGLLSHFGGPEIAGAGGTAFLESFHVHAGKIRKRVAPLKLLASILTISSGGSAGREGPTMHIGAGIGSSLSKLLSLGARERRILVVAGAAAGVGAIFRTPLGGALFAVEVLYRDDFESDAIMPSVLASVTAYSVFTTIVGTGTLFSTADHYPFIASSLPLYGVMAVVVSIFAIFYARLNTAVTEAFIRLAVPGWLKPGIGGLALGLLALALPEVLGVGYGWIQYLIDGRYWAGSGTMGALALLGLAIAKMLATALTVGSGGSGGDFGPSMVLGAFCGSAVGMVFHALFPTVVPDAGAFALVGMAAFVGGSKRVPVSSLIIVCELTGSYDLLVPLMVAEAVCFVLLRGAIMQPHQVGTRVESPAHRDEATVDILESKLVREVYSPDTELKRVSESAPLAEIMRALADSDKPALFVENSDGTLKGLISLESLQSALLDEDLKGLMVAADVTSPLTSLQLDEDLHTALNAFILSGMPVLPVMDNSTPVGLLSLQRVTRAYDEAIRQRIADVEKTLH